MNNDKKITDTDCQTHDHSQGCPNGENVCPIYAEVENLRQEARTDPLTGLFNRRQLCQALDQEMERTRRSQLPTSLIMLDVDHFKQVNDTHGHSTGDAILHHLAQQLLAATRKLDVACRYGGEEFAVVLPSTPLLTAVQVAERLRAGIAASPIEVAGTTHSISVSIGVDSYTQDSVPSVDDFINRVDQRLYQAKRDGRNCVRHGLQAGKVRTRLAQDEKQALSDLFATDPSP